MAAGKCKPIRGSFPEQHRYRVRLKYGQVDSVELEGDRSCGFRAPATRRKLPKLYAIVHDNKVIYVGHTVQPMATRIRQGLQARGEHGYYGYAWKTLDDIEIIVWFFPEGKAEQVEAIEAELVYLLRETTGQWPGFQTEIHFHQVSDRDKAMAERILASIRSHGRRRRDLTAEE